MRLLKDTTYLVVMMVLFLKLLAFGYSGFEAFVGAICFGYSGVELTSMFIQAIREIYIH